MRRWLFPRSYSTPALLILLCIFSTLFAWLSFGLISLAMANFDFLRHQGLMAVAVGGLVQTAEIGLKGALALALFVGFRAVEAEVIHRWVRQYHE